MATKHTPGPWVVRDDLDLTPGGSLTVERNAAGKRWLVAEVHGADGWAGAAIREPVAVANAALLASAPELLEALLVLVDHAQETYPHFESERGQRDIAKAKAAILRARVR